MDHEKQMHLYNQPMLHLIHTRFRCIQLFLQWTTPLKYGDTIIPRYIYLVNPLSTFFPHIHISHISSISHPILQLSWTQIYQHSPSYPTSYNFQQVYESSYGKLWGYPQISYTYTIRIIKIRISFRLPKTNVEWRSSENRWSYNSAPSFYP